MTSVQLSFDFDAPATARAAVNDQYWFPGMVTSLPVMAEIAGLGRRYTQMLPGVIESIDGELANVRIYAAPEWGYRLENYPLHLHLAVEVPLHELGRYHHNRALEQIVERGRVSTGDAAVAAMIRANNARVSQMEAA